MPTDQCRETGAMNQEGDDMVAWIKVKVLGKRGGWKGDPDSSSVIMNGEAGSNPKVGSSHAKPCPRRGKFTCLRGQGKEYEQVK